MNQFWKKYKNNRKFSLLLTNFSLSSSIDINERNKENEAERKMFKEVIKAID